MGERKDPPPLILRQPGVEAAALWALMISASAAHDPDRWSQAYLDAMDELSRYGRADLLRIAAMIAHLSVAVLTGDRERQAFLDRLQLELAMHLPDAEPGDRP